VTLPKTRLERGGKEVMGRTTERRLSLSRISWKRGNKIQALPSQLCGKQMEYLDFGLNDQNLPENKGKKVTNNAK